MTSITKASLPALLALTIQGCVNIQDTVAEKSVSDNNAVKSLYQTALEYTSDGYYESAETSIERALRMEPDNPHLWLSLAKLANFQNDKDKAGQLAVRALRFAGHDESLTGEINRFIRGL